ncbi:MAG: hypothetical protein J6M12_05350 [Clostridia bacterium]|nr:hypothetical protein [Clostridia bacterium]
MKRKLHAILLMLLCLLFVLLPCSSLAQTEKDEVAQTLDGLHIDPSVIELIQPEEGDLIIRTFRMGYGRKENYYTDVKNGHATYKTNGFFFVISQNDGHVERWGNFLIKPGNPSKGTEFKKDDIIYSSVEESPIAFIWDFLQNPQNYLTKDVQIKELYFSLGEYPNSFTAGTYIYAVTDQGHFVLYKEIDATSDEPVFVFPRKDFDEFDQFHSKECERVSQNFGVDLSAFTFTRLLERKTDIDLTKYHAPFDIDRYNQELAFKNTVKIALPILGAVAVGVVIVVLVVVIAVSKKDGTDEPSQAPAESADPDQG